MKSEGYKTDIVMEIAKAAVQSTLANKESAKELAGKHAIKMVERITELVDSRMPDEEIVDEIRKIVFFANVPPHI